MEQLTFREELSRGTMVFDGGMGTYFSASEKLPGQGCEMANIEKPLLISAIHREYLEAGARAIKTNTFSSNRVAYPGGNDVVLRQIRAGFRLAGRTAEAYGAHVFADIGPVTGLDEVRTKEEYRYIIDAFLEQGAKNFLFETNSNTIGLLESARYIRSRVPDAYVIISYAVLPGGYTRDGLFGEDLLQGLLTQPVLSRRGLENLRRAKTSLNCYILGGIMPVISERNARFMNSEVNGIDVEEALIQRYAGLNREEAENLALEVSVEIGKAIADSADGFYVITPFNRVSLVSRIVEAIRDGHVIS